VEILPRTCLFNTSKEAWDVLNAVEGIDACVDVNHFLQEKSEEGILRLGGYVKTLHISDHDYVDERHWLPGNGSIDWMKLIGSLEKIGYTGMFHYESAGTHEEVKQNYLDLFARYNKK
jgi:sugar phosphate isomerase/epimerase